MTSVRNPESRFATLHPILFAVYPVLFLYSHNADEFPPSVVVAPTVISVSAVLLLWKLLAVVLRDARKSAAVVSLFALLFFSYGHFYRFMENSGAMRIGWLGDLKILLILYAIFFLLPASFCLRLKPEKLRPLNRFMSVMGLFLVATSTIQIIAYFAPIKKQQQLRQLSVNRQAGANQNFPDIYYIILDGYPRADLLRQIHKYDNSEFVSHLKSAGFYVADHSVSNYPGTALSLASSLNMQYLDDIAAQQGTGSTNRWPLTERIQNNTVCDFLRKQGYRIVAFDSGYFPTEIRNSDRFLASGWVINEFHNAILDSTPASIWLKNFRRYSLQRKRILFILDHLSNVISRERPSFVFAHIMALHPPFVFGPNGEEIAIKKSSFASGEEIDAQWEQRYQEAFHGQLTFINRKVKSTVTKILSAKVRPAIVILQGDHGSTATEKGRVPENIFYQERFSILNAYYLPDSLAERLYPRISPVNSFRVLFDHYFQTKLGLLKDESFYSERRYPYRLKRVTDRLPN